MAKAVLESLLVFLSAIDVALVNCPHWQAIETKTLTARVAGWLHRA